MADARERVDEEPARYTLSRPFSGRKGPLTAEERATISAIVEQEIIGHPGVRVRHRALLSDALILSCDTGPEVPPEKVIRRMWPKYYEGRRCRRDLEDPEVMLNVRYQSRDFAHLMAMIGLRVTQALNRADGTEGSVWAGRFRSALIAVGEGLRQLKRELQAETLFPARRRREPDWPEFALELVATVAAAFATGALGGNPFTRYV